MEGGNSSNSFVIGCSKWMIYYIIRVDMKEKTIRFYLALELCQLEEQHALRREFTDGAKKKSTLQMAFTTITFIALPILLNTKKCSDAQT